MGIGYQRNGYWEATNYLSGRGLCSQSRSCRLRQGCVQDRKNEQEIRGLARFGSTIFHVSLTVEMYIVHHTLAR